MVRAGDITVGSQQIDGVLCQTRCSHLLAPGERMQRDPARLAQVGDRRPTARRTREPASRVQRAARNCRPCRCRPSLTQGSRSPACTLPAAPLLSALARYSIAVCEIVRNMKRRIDASENSAGMTRGTMCVRTQRARGVSLVTSWNARSVVATSRFAKAMRSGSKVSSSLGAAQPCTTAASFHARLTASPSPVFMPWAPTGLWMCAASPSRKARPARKCAATRWCT